MSCLYNIKIDETTRNDTKIYNSNGIEKYLLWEISIYLFISAESSILMLANKRFFHFLDGKQSSSSLSFSPCHSVLLGFSLIAFIFLRRLFRIFQMCVCGFSLSFFFQGMCFSPLYFEATIIMSIYYLPYENWKAVFYDQNACVR